jgi:hypothetical protein
MSKDLTFTHIFFGPPVERIGTVEAVKQSTLVIRSSGRFTKSIGKMWVKVRLCKVRLGMQHDSGFECGTRCWLIEVGLAQPQ